MKKRLLALALAFAMLSTSSAFAAEYVVKSGDTLWGIAQKMLGNGAKWEEIYEANKDTVKDPNKIYVDQKLNIPDGQTAPAEETEVYTGTANGFHAPVTVAVTFDKNGIAGVEIVDHHETDFVADLAINQMPKDIVAAGTWQVDTYAGCTVSSNAVRQAVRAAVTEAGRSGDMKAAPAKPEASTETLNTDILVIGGGIAGLSAAISAKETNPGVNVILVEKLDRVGGSTVLSGGYMYGRGVDDTPEALAAYWQERAEGNADDAMLLLAAQNASESIDWVIDHGVVFPEALLATGTSPVERARLATNAGIDIIEPLLASAEKLGVTVCTGTAATELLTANGAVTGAKATSAKLNKTYTINAKSVIIATGGYDLNTEMMAEHNPDMPSYYWPVSSPGNTGDGINMAAAVGAATNFTGGVIGFKGIDRSLHYIEGINFLAWAGVLGVTDQGVRFGDEGADYPIMCTQLFTALQNGAEHTYLIVDSAAMGGYLAMLAETGIAKGLACKADTLAELAATAGINADNLAKTVETYNALVANGETDEYGATPTMSVTTGPFYAVEIIPATLGTMGGLLITENAEVKDTNGKAIPGLYAAGEVANSQFLYKEYPASGTSNDISCTFGRIAGANAAKAANTYTATAQGYNGPLTLAVTFDGDVVSDIEIVTSTETDHVGTSALDILIPEIIAAGGTGVDSLAGATFTSGAIIRAVNSAAQAAGLDMTAFRAHKLVHEAKDPIDLTYDVVIVGAGGAGMAAGAQAAQDGNTVIVLEKNAEMGGNTLVAGGSFQVYLPYLCWEEDNPDATTGVYEYDGQTYTKVKSQGGRLNELKTMLTWSEEPFNPKISEELPFVAGDIELNAKRGVHAEYLPILKELKRQIQAYVDWADAKLAADPELKDSDLTLFSSRELHLFQTYYGGLRPSADGSEWIYSKLELIEQFVDQGLETKEWLLDQGARIALNGQGTLIGCLWQRINSVQGGTVDGVSYSSKWGAYFKVPENTIMKADPNNQIMTRTTAYELIEEDGKVVGVKAKQYDGTEVTVHATKGVILATGGYGANIEMVQETNKYWEPDFIADNIGTTNRNSLVGEGITMAEKVGAAVEGMGWTQMMPLGYADNGNLAGGKGENVIFIDPNTGKRFVDESAERDVLSLGAFQHSMTKELAAELGLKYVPGLYVEIANAGNVNTPEAAASRTNSTFGRTMYWTVSELAEKLHLDKQAIVDTITEYDNYVRGIAPTPGSVTKMGFDAGTWVGQVTKNEDGTETYDAENCYLKVRIMAPSTHHTMGGLVVDTERHVLDEDGNAIPGLYAAGEVTSGFMAGNRLGGNAIIEILVSGRIAAKTINEENK